MDYVKELEKYAPAHTDAQVAKEVAKIKMAANRNGNVDVYKFCYSAIDLYPHHRVTGLRGEERGIKGSSSI